MKILFDCTELSYYLENSGHRAGVFYVALNLLREFEKMGIDITFYCDFKRYYFMKEIKEFAHIPLLKEHSLVNQFLGKLLYLTRKFPLRFKYVLLILARFYDCYFYKNNKKNLKQLEGFDVYFSAFSPPSKEIESSNLKIFRMVHDTIPIVENGYPKSPKDWYYKIYNTLKSEDYYFSNSEHTRKDILKYFPLLKPENVKTTLLAANPEFFYKTEDKIIDKKYVFSLCTLGKRKNLEFAIKNFFSFVEKYNITDLTLVLGGGVWKRYEKQLEKLLLQYDRSRVVLSGYIEEEQLKYYYSSALCFIYPSLYEGFGLPVLEAMQCGCPVITSNTTSLPEVIGDCGITIDPTNDGDMIEALKKMYFDDSFRAECSKKGLQRAANFSWSKCSREILEFIKSSI